MSEQTYSSQSTDGSVQGLSAAEVAYARVYEQYCHLRLSESDCILFVRLGAYYEIFGYDAARAAQCLSLRLDEAPAGVHRCRVARRDLDNSIEKLIRNEMAVAIAEPARGARGAKANLDLSRHSIGIVHRPGVSDLPCTVAPRVSQDNPSTGLSPKIRALWSERLNLAMEYDRLCDAMSFADHVKTRLSPEIPEVAWSIPSEFLHGLRPGHEKVEDSVPGRTYRLTAAGFDRLVDLLPDLIEGPRLRELIRLAQAGATEMRIHEAACDAVWAKSGLRELDERSTVAHARLWDIDDDIMAAPAKTLADVQVKARVMKFRCSDNEPHVEYVHALTNSILAMGS